jgi:hypothetical protein
MTILVKFGFPSNKIQGILMYYYSLRSKVTLRDNNDQTLIKIYYL